MAEYTLKFQPSGQNSGWTSFFSFYPDWMVNMNNYLYTFKVGEVWKHNVNNRRNNFYESDYPSNLVLLINDSPIENKMFKNIELNGTSKWAAVTTTDIDSGFISLGYYAKKENTFYSNIYINQNTLDTRYLSVDGVGTVKSVVTIPGPAHKITLNAPIPSSLTQGQAVYVVDTVNNNFYKICYVDSVNMADNSFTTNVLLVTTGPGDILMTAKNQQAESYGVRGHYMKVELTNSETTAVELFSVSSEVFKSYP